MTSHDTLVDRVDDLMVRDLASGSFARLEILPGPHRLGISLNRVTSGVFVTHLARSEYIMICAELQGGHQYRTEPILAGDRFLPQLIDLTENRVVDPRCRSQALPPPSPAPAAVATAPAGNLGEEQTEPPSSPPEEAAAADAEEPPESYLPRVDRQFRRQPLPSDAQPSTHRPGSGLFLSFGAGFGGADFVQASDSNGDTQTLSSGSGAILGIGLMLTPLWAGDSVGFGLGLDAAVKYDNLNADNGSASITRYPIALTAHMLANVSGGNHYLILRGGAIRDFGVNYSASGFANLDASVTGTWGPTGAFGYYKRSNDVFGWDLVAFFALTKHQIGSDSINANSFGVLWEMCWRPW